MTTNEDLGQELERLSELASGMLTVLQRLDGHDEELADVKVAFEEFRQEVLQFQAISTRDRRELRESVESVQEQLEPLSEIYNGVRFIERAVRWVGGPAVVALGLSLVSRMVGGGG